MKNSLGNHPLPIILKAILFKKSSGRLIVRGDKLCRELRFKRGTLQHATSDLRAERLGDMLLAKRIISAEQKHQLDDWQRQGKDEKIGSMLVRANMLNQKQLYLALVDQTKAIAAAAFGMKEGEWEYIRGVPALPRGLGFAIPLEQVIIEGVRTLSDFSFYRVLFGHYPLHVAKLPPSLEPLLSAFDRQFYHKFAPYAGLLAGEVQRKLQTPEKMFWREVLLFYLLNIFEVDEPGLLLACETDTLLARHGELLNRAR